MSQVGSLSWKLNPVLNQSARTAIKSCDPRFLNKILFYDKHEALPALQTGSPIARRIKPWLLKKPVPMRSDSKQNQTNDVVLLRLRSRWFSLHVQHLSLGLRHRNGSLRKSLVEICPALLLVFGIASEADDTYSVAWLHQESLNTKHRSFRRISQFLSMYRVYRDSIWSCLSLTFQVYPALPWFTTLLSQSTLTIIFPFRMLSLLSLCLLCSAAVSNAMLPVTPREVVKSGASQLSFATNSTACADAVGFSSRECIFTGTEPDLV